MKINQKFPQFSDERALIILAGGLATEFYVAGKGEIEKIDSFAVKLASYSDQEGFFMKSGYGKIFGSQSILRNLDQHADQKFKQDFRDKFKKITAKKKINSIYLISPSYRASDILQIMGKVNLRKIKLVIYGELTGRHPVKILERIQEAFDDSIENKNTLTERKPLKIMKKSERVREVVGNKYSMKL